MRALVTDNRETDARRRQRASIVLALAGMLGTSVVLAALGGTTAGTLLGLAPVLGAALACVLLLRPIPRGPSAATLWVAPPPASPPRPLLDRVVPPALRRGAFRFVIYGSLMVAGEVGFYSLVKIGRRLPDWLAWPFAFQWRVDPSLGLDRIWEVPIASFYGQASLWMFWVYASIVLLGLEPTWRRVRAWPWLVRGMLYMLIILTMECALGWALVALTGWRIWYYTDGPLTLFVYTSWAIAPMWFALGLLSENFIHIIDKLVRAAQSQGRGQATSSAGGDDGEEGRR